MATEIKVLKQLHLLLTDEERQLKKSRRIFNSVLTATWLILAGIFFFLFSGRLDGTIGAMATGLVGTIAGSFMQAGESNRQWPYLKSHFNPESVERRLKELDS